MYAFVFAISSLIYASAMVGFYGVEKISGVQRAALRVVAMTRECVVKLSRPPQG